MDKIRFGFHDPLNAEDTEKLTLGCRANNPDICANNMLDGICAFASIDNICHKLSVAWKKQYNKLKEKEAICEEE